MGGKLFSVYIWGMICTMKNAVKVFWEGVSKRWVVVFALFFVLFVMPFFSLIAPGFDVANSEEEPETIKVNRLFSRLIQVYHPDKYNAINREIELFFRDNDIASLRYYEKVFSFEKGRETESVAYHEKYDIDGEDFENFGMGFVDEEYSGQGAAEQGDVDLFAALTRELCGEHEHTLSFFDLYSLDGELDLSDYGIVRIEGIEGCVHITSLNLSGNRIENVSPLAGMTGLESLFLAENRISDIECLGALTGLRELDLSFNEIADVSVLTSLHGLQFVNLTGNRLKSPAADEAIRRLREKDVIVVY